MITKTYYAPRLRKTGQFFFWEQLCDDGYGIYYPRDTNFEPDDFPLMLKEPTLGYRASSFHIEMYSHSSIVPLEEIEFVPVTINL